MQSMAWGWLTYQLTNSKFLLGVIAALGAIPISVLSVPAGSLADRIEKRGVLILTQSALMVLALLLAELGVSAGAGEGRRTQNAVSTFILGRNAQFLIWGEWHVQNKK